MPLGQKAQNSRIDTLMHMNMGIQRYSRRSYFQEADFSKCMHFMREFNQGKTPEEKLRIPAILMKASALAYDYIDKNGNKPYRRLSGYLPFFPWGGSWESATIDISLMIVRPLDGVQEQTCNYTFREVDKHNSVVLSQRIWDIMSKPEDEIPEFVFLKKTAHLPMPLLYLLLQLTRIPWIRAQIVAPTSVSILPQDIKWVQGEHTSMIVLNRIDPETNKGLILWTFDHRLGMGIHFAGFIEHLKHILEDASFLQRDIGDYQNGIR